MINKEEVKRVAKLARLGLTEREIAKYQKELSLILDYIEKLKEVDVFGAEPTSHPLKAENITRKDAEKPNIKNQERRRLLDLAPETQNNYLKVKQIL